MATIGSETEQVSADPTNTVEYGSTSYVKLTASTYDVELQNGNKLVINSEKAIYEVEDDIPTAIQGGYSVIDEEIVNPNLEIDQSSGASYPVAPNLTNWEYNGMTLYNTYLSNSSLTGNLTVPNLSDVQSLEPRLISDRIYYRALYMVEYNTPGGLITPIGQATANGGIPAYISIINKQESLSIYGLYTIDNSDNVTPVLDQYDDHITIELQE